MEFKFGAPSKPKFRFGKPKTEFNFGYQKFSECNPELTSKVTDPEKFSFGQVGPGGEKDVEFGESISCTGCIDQPNKPTIETCLLAINNLQSTYTSLTEKLMAQISKLEEKCTALEAKNLGLEQKLEKFSNEEIKKCKEDASSSSSPNKSTINFTTTRKLSADSIEIDEPFSLWGTSDNFNGRSKIVKQKHFVVKKVPNKIDYSESWLNETLSQNVKKSGINAKITKVTRIVPYFKQGLTKSFSVIIEYDCDYDELLKTDIWISGTKVENFKRRHAW